MNETKIDVNQDMESGFSEGKQKASARSKQYYEAAFLLMFWSFLVINEGLIRFIDEGTPASAGLFSPEAGQPNRFVGPFLGGLFEIIFGLFGLFVGMGAALLDYHNPSVTKLCMLVQAVLGWYVFIDFVFVLPSYQVANLQGPIFNAPFFTNSLSEGQLQFLVVLGILTSMHWCLALQGGQFLFMARLVAADTGSDFLKQRSGAKMRSLFWNMNFLLSGLWSFIFACLLIDKLGGGEYPAPFVSPPNAGTLPGLTLFTSLLMMLWPLIGMGISITNRHSVVKAYITATIPVFLFVFLNYTIVQLGIIGAVAGASKHHGLLFMLMFLGPYFMLKQTEDTEQ